MALNTGTVWEVRTTGAATNGGGFYNRTPGTSTDYSQSDTPILALTDLAHTGGSTTITSAVGGFTNAMIGNVAYLVGTAVTTGWYEITAVASAGSATIDRSCGAGDATNATCNIGGAIALLDTIDNVIVAGNTIWVKNGTYTTGSNLSFTAGTASSILSIKGYYNTRGDITTPGSANRPTLTMAAYTLTSGGYSHFSDIIISSTYSSGAEVNINIFSTADIIERCKFMVTYSGTAKVYTIYAGGTNLMMIDSEIIHVGTPVLWDGPWAMGIRFATGSNSCKFLGCYFKNIGGVVMGGFGNNAGDHVIYDCIIDTCASLGYNQPSAYAGYGITWINNDFYNVAGGAYQNGGTPYGNVWVNNILYNSVNINLNGGTSNYVNYNDMYDTYYDGPASGIFDMSVDPLFTDPAGGIFTIPMSSPIWGSGYIMKLGVS